MMTIPLVTIINPFNEQTHPFTLLLLTVRSPAIIFAAARLLQSIVSKRSEASSDRIRVEIIPIIHAGKEKMSKDSPPVQSMAGFRAFCRLADRGGGRDRMLDRTIE